MKDADRICYLQLSSLRMSILLRLFNACLSGRAGAFIRHRFSKFASLRTTLSFHVVMKEKLILRFPPYGR